MSTDPEDLLVSAGGDGVVLVDGDVVVVVAIKKNAFAGKSGKSCKSPLGVGDFLSVVVIRWPDSFGRCTQIAKTIRPMASTRPAAIAPRAQFRGQGMSDRRRDWWRVTAPQLGRAASVLCNSLTTALLCLSCTRNCNS